MLSLYPWTKLRKDFIWAINKKLTINNKFRKPFDWETVPLIDWSQSYVTNCIKIILTVEELSPNCVKRKNKRSSQIKWRYWLITDTANKKVGT